MWLLFCLNTLSVAESASHLSENIQISNTLVQLYLTIKPIINKYIYMNRRVDIM